MMRRLLLFVAMTAPLWAQGPGERGGSSREAPVKPVPFERILRAADEPQNWLTYSGGLLSQRHSALTQINPENAKNLKLSWQFQGVPAGKHEVTPLVVDGVLYTVQRPNEVFALDAATGKTIWQYSHQPEAGVSTPWKLSRGLAILGDKLFLAALDAKLIALDAKTGKELWNTRIADHKLQYSFTVAPIVVKDKVILGPAGGEYGIRGFLAAFDANTGKEVWRFYTVPAAGEPGNETWMGQDGKPNDSWLHGSAPIWTTGSYDPETNLTYWGTGNPGPDYNGDNRMGDNLYSSSLIALDADTGKLRWHYQFSPHDQFDWDSTQVPVLADITFRGASRKVLMLANRNGVFYVLDRKTGEFLLGKSFIKTNWYSGFDTAGRPIRLPESVPNAQGVLIYPGNQGGTNWYSPSFSPVTGLFYIPAWENSSATYSKGQLLTYREGQGFMGTGPGRGAANEDVFSSIIAVDPGTGDRRWTFRLSAASTEGGVLTTKSNMVFAGGRDGQFVALDAREGKLLWETRLTPPTSVSAGPMTYMANGKQFVSIQCGNTLFTFAE